MPDIDMPAGGAERRVALRLYRPFGGNFCDASLKRRYTSLRRRYATRRYIS